MEDNQTKITALCITFNEEKHIKRYLKDISFADEIIMVDSYSTDRTKEFALQNPKVKFLERKFDNFTNQKNFAIEQASHPWIMFFDLDEHIPDNLKLEILAIASSINTKDAYWVYRKFFFKGKYIRYSGWQNDKVIRLFKKNKAKYKEARFVHEEMIIDSIPGFLKNKIDHYSFDSYESYKKKLDHYAELKAKELFENNKKANFFHRKIKPIYRFIHHYLIQLGIFDGKEGFIISKMYAEYISHRYKSLDKLWEK